VSDPYLLYLANKNMLKLKKKLTVSTTQNRYTSQY
jgi:hypothetical protein